MKKLLLILFFISSLFSKELQKTSVQLMWYDQFQFAGFYIAKEKGFYKEAGLDVELKRFTNSTNVLQQVLNDKADFGVSSSSLIIDKSNGKNINILGAIFQTSPLTLIALKNSSIEKISDFKNKRLMITNEQLDFATFKAMLISNKIDINSMKILPHSFNIDDLINNNTDLMLSYTTNEPFLLEEKAMKVNYFIQKIMVLIFMKRLFLQAV